LAYLGLSNVFLNIKTAQKHADKTIIHSAV